MSTASVDCATTCAAVPYLGTHAMTGEAVAR